MANSSDCVNAFNALCQAFETMCADCSCNETGQIILNQGNHEVVITTGVPPVTVYLSVQPDGTPVCIGSIDMVGYSLNAAGFTLYADIESNSAVVSYIIKS
jgi:hypothetical protein